MRQGEDPAAVGAGHRFGGEHRVEDGFGRGVDGGLEDRIDGLIRDCLHGRDFVGTIGTGVRGGKGDEDVAG